MTIKRRLYWKSRSAWFALRRFKFKVFGKTVCVVAGHKHLYPTGYCGRCSKVLDQTLADLYFVNGLKRLSSEFSRKHNVDVLVTVNDTVLE